MTPVPGAFTYNWRVALASAPTVVVQLAQSTASSNTLSNLTPGLVYNNVEANAVGAAGPSDWTAPMPKMVA